jgi:hypothetical protein
MASPISGTGRKESELFVLSTPAQVLRFDVVRDGHGAYHLGALVHARDRVTGLAARYDGGPALVAELFSVPSVGGSDTGGDGEIAYPKTADYESLRVAVGPEGTTLLVWTNGRRTTLGELDRAGRASQWLLPGPGKQAALAVDARGGVNVLAVGQKSCGIGYIFCNDDVSFLSKVDNVWQEALLGERLEGAPELVLSSDDSPKAVLLDTLGLVIEARAPAHKATWGVSWDLLWGKPAWLKSGPWLVGLSQAGTLHAQSIVGNVPRDYEDAPVLDLTSLDPESTNHDAVGYGSEIYVLASTRGISELRRLHVPEPPGPALAIEYTEQRPRHVRLGSDQTFGDFHMLPHSGAYASFYRVVGTKCRVPLANALKVALDPVLMPAQDALRVLGPQSDTSWELKEYRLPPANAAPPAPPQASPAGSSTLPECPEHASSLVKPALTRSETLKLPGRAVWVSQETEGVYALVEGAGVFALDWFAWKKSPLSPEVVANIETGADPTTLTVRRDPSGHVHVAYALPAKNEVVHAVDGQVKERVSADAAKFALLFDRQGTPGWVVRRRGKLLLETLAATSVTTRVLVETDALPLAAIAGEHDTLTVALSFPPHQAPVIVSFGQTSKWTATLGPRCGRGQLRGARFLTPGFVTLGCDHPPEPGEVD